jgi:hypothetical protein
MAHASARASNSPRACQGTTEADPSTIKWSQAAEVGSKSRLCALVRVDQGLPVFIHPLGLALICGDVLYAAPERVRGAEALGGGRFRPDHEGR